jgi:hypothetical protein
MSKYYITHIDVTVLSEYPYDPDSLEDLSYDITEGDCVGNFLMGKSKELTGKQMADKLYELGSEPAFFQLDDDGNSTKGADG